MPQSEAELRAQKLYDAEENHPISRSSDDNCVENDEDENHPQEEIVTTKVAFTNYQLYIGVAVFTVVVALFLHETHTNGNRLTDLETTVDKLLKNNNYFKTLDEFDTKVKDMGKTIKDASYSLIGLDNNIQMSEGRMNDINKRLDEEEKNLTVVTLALNEQSGKQEELKNDLEQSKKRLNNVMEESGTIEKSIKTSGMHIKSLENNIKELDQKFSESDIQSKNITDTQDNLQQGVFSIQRELKDLSNDMNTIGGKLPGFETKAGELLQRLVTAESKLEKMSKLDDEVKYLRIKMHGINTEGEKMETKTTALFKSVSTFDIKIQEYEGKLDQYKFNIEAAAEKQTLLGKYLGKLKTDTETTSKDVKVLFGKTDSLKIFLDKTEKEVKEKIKNIGEDISKTDSKVQTLTTVVENIKEYSDQQVPALKARLIDVEKMASMPYFCMMDIVEIIAIIIIILSMRDSSFSSSAATMAGSSGTTRHASNYVTPQSILSKINRAPVFENKICIVSFYSETLNLHKMMLVAALQNSRRAQGFQIVQNLVKRHEDILEIPNARYIFVFVDFNERNVILENPGQDLGDKKLVTVQAACKLGATVFVTYVRNKGSRTLPPGVLYNTELTAFTSHFALRGLTAQGRCFSVYESFSQSQKEHIAEAIH